ncbi:MAG TPA: hypothetical protein VG873_03860 [Burkholderiales bacterium]|nr:hypothetical protein [Burkholderiales bacterium]
MKRIATSAIALAFCVAMPATTLAQGAKGPVTNPSAAQAKKQASEDDLLAGRKGSPQAKKADRKAQSTVQGPAQGPQGQRKADMKHKGDMKAKASIKGEAMKDRAAARAVK